MTNAIVGETALDLTPVIEAMPETTLADVMLEIHGEGEDG